MQVRLLSPEIENDFLWIKLISVLYLSIHICYYQGCLIRSHWLNKPEHNADIHIHLYIIYIDMQIFCGR